MSILNNIIERRESAASEANMSEFRAGARKRRPTHPGAIIARELEALGMTPYSAAPKMGISKQMLGNLISEKSSVTPAMALRLGKFFGNGGSLWLALQADVDLWDAERELAQELKEIKRAPKREKA